MVVAEQNLLLAVRNVARHGDTDVFPSKGRVKWHSVQTLAQAPIKAL
jgi:hypothetical protein